MGLTDNISVDKNLGSAKNNKRKTKSNRDSRRRFTVTQQKEILHRQKYLCDKCGDKLDLRATEFDHIAPWADEGKTIVSNGRALCSNCHRKISSKNTLKKIDKKRKTKKGKGLLDSTDFF